MGCCYGTPGVPENIIPDPSEEESCVFTIKKQGMFADDYLVYRGDSTEEENRWMFMNKTGSIFKNGCIYELENYIREDSENPKKGQVLYTVNFESSPHFEQRLKTPMMAGFQMFNSLFNDAPQDPDDAYFLQRVAFGRDDRTLMIKWCMNTTAFITPGVRSGFGRMTMNVRALGTALGCYDWHPERVERDDEGNETRHPAHWTKQEKEYVSYIQYQLVGPDGAVVAEWAIQGDAFDERNNYDTPWFGVRQDGGWFTTDPPIITTKEGVDPCLAMTVAHLCTRDFSIKGIKDDLNPHFPENPNNAGIGMIFSI